MSLVSQIPQLSKRDKTPMYISMLNEADNRACLSERETAKTPKIKSEIYLKKSDFFDDEKDEKSEKADFGKIIENKNSKHMIMVP